MNECKAFSIKQKISECIHDPKRLWKELKKLTSDCKNNVEYMEIDGKIIFDNLEVPNKFNEFSIKCVKEINDSIVNISYEPPAGVSTFTWSEFKENSIDDMKEVLSKINTKTGLNNVNGKVIEMFMNNHPDIILNIFNESLRSGVAPSVWKYTVVSPIPKIKNSVKASDMRPINMAPSLDKVLQALVKKQLDEYIQNAKILTRYQSAFRGKHSCETALNLVLNEWNHEKATKKKIIAVFLDLKKAFETVDRTILLRVLKRYGFGGVVLEWFQSWLSNRVQITSFCNVRSDAISIEIGVPQGTPLSCPLFNLYVNDIVTVSEKCKLNLFADDALLWVVADDLEEGIRLIKNGFRNIKRFLNMYKLRLNINKTKYILGILICSSLLALM